MGERRHEDRPDLVGEHPAGDAGQLILVGVFLVTWAVDSFWLQATTWLNEYVSLYVRIPVAVVVLAVGVCLARASTRKVFGEVREEAQVITDGVYGVVRHPVYLAVLLFYAGLLAGSISVVAAVAWLVAIVFYLYIACHEEALLIAALGDDYEEYRRRVPMLIPGL